jgi:hypothetical protein
MVDYVSFSLPKERALLFSDFEKKLKSSSQKSKLEIARIFASFSYLESFLHLRKAQILSEDAFKRFKELNQKASIHPKASKGTNLLYNALLVSIRDYLPSRQLKEGYGIPIQPDFKINNENDFEEENRKRADVQAAMKVWIQENFASQFAELDEIIANKARFKQTKVFK